MPEPVIPLSVDPAGYSPETRARAVAALLAAGLARLRRRAATVTSAPVSSAENPPESEANRLAVGAEQSVTVSAG